MAAPIRDTRLPVADMGITARRALYDAPNPPDAREKVECGYANSGSR
jgi:hypothetical protein